MTTPGGAGTPPKALQLPRARHTGFCYWVGAPTTPTVRDSDLLSWIETLVTFCGMVGLQAMVLGRSRRKPSSSKSVCSILPIVICGPELPHLPG
jgi:hypothetical protein